jgi:glycosyltransferase involved in cell wall biosynthesis
VLWVIKGLGPGGAERLLVSIAQAADPSIVSFEAAYVLPYKQHLVAELEAAGVTTHLLGERRGLADPRWLLRLRRLLRKGFDVVHVHSPSVATPVRLLVRTCRHRPALVATDHNLWSSYGRVTRAANAMSLALDDAHLAVSDEVRDSMSPRAAAHTRVIVHGVPVAALHGRSSERAAQREKLGLADDQIAVMTVANLRWTKDYPTLFQAARDVAERRPQVQFFAAGQGPLADALAADVERLGLGGRFRMLGFVADTAGLLSASDLFVLSSRVEGLPIALLEAMALERPVIATAVGAVPSVITSGVEGRLVPPGQPAAIAAAIDDLVCDPTGRAAMGRAAYERVQSYDISNAVQTLESLYVELTR